MRSDLEDITVFLHAETEKAYRVSTTGTYKDAVWLPKSQCELEPISGTTCHTLTARQSLLEEKGLV